MRVTRIRRVVLGAAALVTIALIGVAGTRHRSVPPDRPLGTVLPTASAARFAPAIAILDKGGAIALSADG